MLLNPSPCHKLSHLGPLPLERDVLYGRPLRTQDPSFQTRTHDPQSSTQIDATAVAYTRDLIACTFKKDEWER